MNKNYIFYIKILPGKFLGNALSYQIAEDPKAYIFNTVVYLKSLEPFSSKKINTDFSCTYTY